jgi:hypothetical protein
MQKGKLGCEAEFTFTTTSRIPKFVSLLRYIQPPKFVSIFYGNVYWVVNNYNFQKKFNSYHLRPREWRMLFRVLANSFYF